MKMPVRPRPRLIASVLVIGSVLLSQSGVRAQGGDSALPANAAKLGFAGQLPADTEFYLGTAQLKTHLDNLKKSAYWKDLQALINDKTPAPSAGDHAMKAADKLWGDDLFIAGGPSFAKDVALLRKINHLYSEINFHTLMAGVPGAAPQPNKGKSGAAPAKPNPLVGALDDPQLLAQLEEILQTFELPPLLIGAKTQDPNALIKELIPADVEKNMALKGKLSEMTLPDGSHFKTLELEGAKLLSDKDKDSFLAGLPANTKPASRELVAKCLKDFQTKHFALAWGTHAGYIVFAAGQNLSHLKFAAGPNQSLLSKPELSSLAPYTSKNLLGLFYANAETLNGLADDQPLTPLLRGAVGAMKTNPTFRDIGRKLEPSIDQLATLEKSVYGRQFSAIQGVFWWDNGLHGESFGGAKTQEFLTGVPLQFSSLLNDPKVLFAVDYVRNAEYNRAVRAWLEKFVSVLYQGAHEFAQAGVAGPQGGQQLALFDALLVPTLEKIYDANKDMNDRGLSGESAAIVDLNGKMANPAAQMAPKKGASKSAAAPGEVAIPRFSVVAQVADRPLLAKDWDSIQNILVALASLPFGGPGGGKKPTWTTPQSSLKDGITTYFYDLSQVPVVGGLGDDLTLSSAISDKILVLSTSKSAAQTLAAEALKAMPGTTDGLLWKFDAGLLPDLLGSVPGMMGETDKKSKDQMKQVIRWIKPFHLLQGHSYQEKGQTRTSFSWEIHDVLSFD